VPQPPLIHDHLSISHDNITSAIERVSKYPNNQSSLALQKVGAYQKKQDINILHCNVILTVHVTFIIAENFAICFYFV